VHIYNNIQTTLIFLMVLVFVVILTNKNAFAICIYVEGNVPNWDSILEENCEYRLGSYITLSN